MKIWLGAVVILSLAGFGARAAADRNDAADPVLSSERPSMIEWREPAGFWDPAWASDLGRAASVQASAPAPETILDMSGIDVVDAHWMALTMWGEARREGEAGMRAVGHVIANRWMAGRHGSHVTDTVSQAYQFSCWNAGDPNRAAMLNIDSLAPASEDYRMWMAAKEIARDILAGRSRDPTGGALFYHAVTVSPRWSEGIAPDARIGNHLFFRAVR